MNSWWHKFLTTGKIEDYIKYKEENNELNGGSNGEQLRRDSD
ncbi:hypothetical protein RJG79_05755 [Mycoplasmatota bacterium WC44]